MMGKNIAFVFSSNPDYQIVLYDLYETDVNGGIRTNTQQLVDVARRGTDIVTITYKTIMSVCDMIQPTLDIYLDRFMNDWEAGKTYFG